MLKTMRKNVKSLAPTLWIVIAAFIVAIFAVWGGAGRLGEKARTETIAYMGKENISVEAYYLALRQRIEALQKEYRELNKMFLQQLNIPQQVLEQMIQQSLLEQKAEEMGVGVTDKELRERIVKMFQRDGKFVGYEEYRQILEWNRMSVANFEEGLKKDIVLAKMVQLLTAGITATPEELWENYRKQNENAKIEYLLLEESKIQFEDALDQAELADFFEKNKDKYAIPEKREGSYVFFLTEDVKKEVKLSDAEIEKYYKDNLDQFKEPEKVRVSRIYLPFGVKATDVVQKEAQDLLDRISTGEDFARIAQSHSQDDKATDGGDWGLTEWRKLSAKEREEIEKLGQAEVSKVVEAEDGLSILKVTEKEPEKIPPFEDVKSRVKTMLEDQKARDLAAEKIAQLEKGARREKSLDMAAQKAGLKVKSTGLLKQGQGLEEFDPSGSLSQTLFGLKEKEISTAVYTFSGTGIAQLEKVEPTRPAKFEEVKEDVEKDFRNRKKKERALQQIREARAKVEGKNWEETADKIGLEFKNANEHRREQYLATVGENAELDRLAFSLPLNQTSEPVEYATGYLLLRVLERKEASREELGKNMETEKANFLELKKNKFLQAYLNKLREEKNVKVNYNLFLQINNDVLSRFDRQE